MDVAHIVEATSLERDVVIRVCDSLGNDVDAVGRALDQFYNGAGPFTGAPPPASGWVERKKNSSKKGDDDHASSFKEDGRQESARRPGKGEGKGGSKGEGRGRGTKGEGSGRGRGRGRESPSTGDRPARDAVPAKAPSSEPPVINGTATHSWDASAEVPAKIFVSAKQPTISAWSQPRDWSIMVPASAPEPAPEVSKPSPPAPQNSTVIEPEASAPTDSAATSAPSSREKNGRGRGNGRDRNRNRDAETFGDAALQNNSRGRGKGRVRDGRPVAEVASADDVSAPSGLPLEMSSSELSLPNAELTLPSNDLPEFRMTSELSLPNGELGISASMEMQAGLQVADPAILMVGSGPVPVGESFANSDNSTGALMPTLLGVDAKLQFGSYDGAPTTAQPSKQFLGGFDISSHDVAAPKLESICQPGSVSSCGLSSPPVALPLPASLANVLPASGGTALPGFRAGSCANDSGALEASEQQLAGGLQQLHMGSDLPQVLPSNTTSESSLPASLTGMLPSSGLAPQSQSVSLNANHAPNRVVQGMAPPEGLSTMPPALSSMPPQQVLPTHEPPRSTSNRVRNAQMTNPAQSINASVPPPSVVSHNTVGTGLGLELIGCPTSGAPDDSRPSSLSQPPMQSSLMPPPAAIQMAYDAVPSMGAQPLLGYDMPISQAPPQNLGRNPNEKEGRSRNSRAKKKTGSGGGRDGGCQACPGQGFNGSMPPLGPDGMNPNMMPPGLAMHANGAGAMGMRCGDMPSSTAQGAAGMMPPQQQYPPPQQQQFYVSPAIAAMPNCYSYGTPTGLSGMCAYAPPGAGMGAGMYQHTPTCTNLYQAPPQYAQQQPQAYVPQQQQYVQQAQQPFGMSQQSGTGAGGYAYQSPPGMSMGGGGGMGGGGMGGGQPFNSHNGPSYGYDDADSYNSQPPGMFGGGPPSGYYRPS